MKKLLLLCLLLAPIATAQGPYRDSLAVYTVTRETTLSAASEAITIQQPASGARIVRLVSASIYCAGTCDVSQERNGSGATTTALTIAQVNPKQGAPSATAFYASNVGTPVSTLPKFTISGGAQTVDLDDIYLQGPGTGENYTLRVGPTTGRVIITIKWREY